jgi:ABC-type polysaccharide/polyol phosphate export permease
VVAERIRVPQFGTRSRFAYLKQRAADLYEFRYLVQYLASSGLKVERVSFAFGFVWWLLDPILMIAMWTLLMVVIFGRVSKGYPFPLFLMSTMLSWQFMTRAVRNSVNFTHAKELQMRPIAFPRAVFPLANTLAESVKLCFAILLFPIAALLFGQSLSPMQLLIIPLLPILIAITVGIAWFLAAFNFVFRDTARLIDILFRFWVFLSPVIYTLHQVPAKLRPVFLLNPMSLILESERDVLLMHTIHPTLVAGALVTAVVTLTIGFVYFHRQEPRFARLN